MAEPTEMSWTPDTTATGTDTAPSSTSATSASSSTTSPSHTDRPIGTPEPMPKGAFVPVAPTTSLETLATMAYGDKIHSDVADKRPDDATFQNPNNPAAIDRLRVYADAIAAKTREYADRLFFHNQHMGLVQQRNTLVTGQSVHLPDELPELPKPDSQK